MRRFCKVSLPNNAELKALLVAVVFSLLFIVFLTAVYPRGGGRRFHAPPPATPENLSPPQFSSPDPNNAYRAIPDDFVLVDFANFSYGPYTNADGTQMDLLLTQGELLLPNNTGWFSLKDVYFADVTGDNKVDAIVRLSHLECDARSCDGGSDLFFIFKGNYRSLTRIWHYETGSYGYGCGLKSLTASGKQVQLALFGRCSQPRLYNPAAEKYVSHDLTYILFEFNGHHIGQKSLEYVPTPPNDVRNYQPSIRFF